MLPSSLSQTLADHLGGTPSNSRGLSGGDINQAAYFEVNGTPYFVKWNQNAPATMFPTEAAGLKLLRAANAIRVPEVVLLVEANGAAPACLVLEWIPTGGGKRRDDVMEAFGASLAELHRTQAAAHGLDHANFIGRLPQPNDPSESWTEFYRAHRIGAQMAIARQRGRLPRRREDLLTRLMARLPDLLDDEAMPPSLLHGDLWGGNYLVDDQGQAVLIDPAVYYGHREMDLAMTELFGGFSPRFYDAYHAAYPIDPGYAERRSLYQLYYVLVHLNLFGESYGGQVDSIARRYL